MTTTLVPRPTRTVTVEGHMVNIGGRNTENAGLLLAGRLVVPVEIAALAAGKDAWMRQIPVECAECLCEFKLCDSDSAEYCQECFDKACEENALIDA